MNQILMVEDKKKSKKKNRSSGPVEIKNIVMFFAIFLIVFGISLIGQGSYAIYKEAKGSNKEDLPVVRLSRVNDSIIIDVSSKNEIEKLRYSWNDSEETIIPIQDIYIKEEILMPNENSILNITLEDVTGRAIKYQKECIVEGIDIAKPSIDIVDQEDNQGSIKIIATDETQISYITYKVNDEDTIRIDRSQTENTTITYVLKLERGQNKVLVTAVDTSGNIETIEKTIEGVEKSTIDMVQNGNILTITAKDVEGINYIEINFNGVVYAGKDLNQKEMVLAIQLKEGSNTVKVKVVNVKGIEKEDAREFYYAQ